MARRGLGAFLLVLLLFPLYRWVGGQEGSPAAEQTLRLGGQYLTALWLGCLLGVALAFALGWVVSERAASAAWQRLERALTAASSNTFAAGAGLVAASLSGWVSAAVLARKPALLDGVSQLVQARYFAAGMPTGPRLGDPAFWQFQFMVLTRAGWTSQYPPGFPVLLALAGRIVPLWVVGPLLLGAAIALTSLVADRLFESDRAVGRVGVAFAAFSPFLAFHAAGYMSHVLALALVALALFASLRAANGAWGWSLLSGAALGAAFATRPFTAVVLGLVATAGVWLAFGTARALGARASLVHGGAVALGAAPFLIATLAYNRFLFGSPFEFGYVAGEGPGHGIGFHLDPWGHAYGAREAVGYTSADLQGLSLDLLQTPVPAAVVVAAYLLFARRLSAGVRVAAAWALLPVLGQAFYWHHDLFMGPRLLYEAGPGWCLLLAAAAAAVIRAVPPTGGRLRLTRAGVAGSFAFALLVSLLYAGPAKLKSYRAVAQQAGMAVSPIAPAGPSLVFVHGSWQDRVAARLAATGMRVDSIRAALLYNSTCRAELYVERLERAEETGEDAPEALAQRADPARPFRDLRMPSGSVVRTFEGETLDPMCEREAASDFEGAVGLPPLLWQGDLPGLGSTGAMFVRDLGPERNVRLLAEFPERKRALLVRQGGELRLEEYDAGERRLWLGR